MEDHPFIDGVCFGCGNGKVEDGEECDDNNPSCFNCKCAEGFKKDKNGKGCTKTSENNKSSNTYIYVIAGVGGGVIVIIIIILIVVL